MRAGLPVTVALVAERRWASATGQTWVREARFTYHHGKSAKLSPELCRLLGAADGCATLAELGERAGLSSPAVLALVPELRELWGNRMVALTA